MSGESIGGIRPQNTRQQFKDYLRRSTAQEAPQNHDPLAPQGHELLFSRNWFSDPGKYFRFDSTARWNWIRQQFNRLRARDEVAKLIDDQFEGKDIIVSKRWLIPDETLGDRVMKDCAPGAKTSFGKIDDEALKEIAKRIAAIRTQLIVTPPAYDTTGPFKLKHVRQGKLVIEISHEDLRAIYSKDTGVVAQPAPNGSHSTNHDGDDVGDGDTATDTETHSGSPMTPAPKDLRNAPAKSVGSENDHTEISESSSDDEDTDTDDTRYFSQTSVTDTEEPHQKFGNHSDYLPLIAKRISARKIPGRELEREDSLTRTELLAALREEVKNGVADAIYDRALIEHETSGGSGSEDYAQYLGRAARRGVADAQYDLAQIFKGGPNRTEADDLEYVRWLVSATQKNHHDATEEIETIKEEGPAHFQFALGKLYAEGQPEIEQDKEEAESWYRRALDLGHQDAKNALDDLAENGVPNRPQRYQPNPEFELPAWWPLVLVKLEDQIETIKIADKMARDQHSISFNSQAANDCLQKFKLQHPSAESVEFQKTTSAKLIDLLQRFGETGEKDDELETEVKGLDKKRVQSRGEIKTFINRLKRLLKNDETARDQKAAGNRFVARDIVTNDERDVLEAGVNRLASANDPFNSVVDHKQYWLNRIIDLMDDEDDAREEIVKTLKWDGLLALVPSDSPAQ